MQTMEAQGKHWEQGLCCCGVYTLSYPVSYRHFTIDTQINTLQMKRKRDPNQQEAGLLAVYIG